MERKTCPYCGEEIAATAKKCRFCGEWLDAEETVAELQEVTPEVLPYSYPQNPPMAAPMNVPVAGEYGAVPAVQQPAGVPVYTNNPAYTPQVTVGQPVQGMQGMQGMQTPVINIQLNNETNVNQEVSQEVNQEVTVVSGGRSAGTGILWWELGAVGVGTWVATGKWWVGLLTWIALAIATQIPFIGAALCVILGCGVGLLAGAISAACSAPTWVCWVIGLFVAAGVIALNFDDKDDD